MNQADANRSDAHRLAQARRVLAEQRRLADVLGTPSVGNVTLQLVFRLYVAHLEGRVFTVRELLDATGPHPNVTWRWLLVLVEDGSVALSSEGRGGPVNLTAKGVERVRAAVDAMAMLTDQDLAAA